MSKKEFTPTEKQLALDIKQLIVQTRQQVAVAVNSAITLIVLANRQAN